MKSAVGRLLVWVLAALLADSAGAQSPTPSNNQSQFNTAGFSPQVGIVFVVLIVAVFALGYCSIYLRHCYGSPGSAANFQATPGRTWRGTRGLGKDVIDGFPTFSYSEVKDHKIGKGALECAVCLNEFEDADTLRLLPKCDHVFHPECIGAWLEHHITCPVCRSDLSKAVEEVPPVAGESMENDTGHMQGEVVVEVNEIQIADIDTKSPRRGTSTDFPRSSTIGKSEAFDLANFRSHTTGHSLVLPGENLDRFTLKLPHGVRKEVMERCMLNRTRSTAAGTSTFNSDGGRGGGATFIQRFQRSMKSDRQAIFTRTASLFSPKVSTDGSNAGGGRSTTRMSTLNCLEPKAADDHEAELIPNDASQLSSRAGLWAGLEPARPNNA